MISCLPAFVNVHQFKYAYILRIIRAWYRLCLHITLSYAPVYSKPAHACRFIATGRLWLKMWSVCLLLHKQSVESFLNLKALNTMLQYTKHGHYYHFSQLVLLLCIFRFYDRQRKTTPSHKSLVPRSVLLSLTNVRTQPHNMHIKTWLVNGIYLVMFSWLDRLERTDPVLHLFPVLSAEDEPTERSDHLDRAEDRCPGQRIWRKIELGKKQWKTQRDKPFPAMSSSACGATESREWLALSLRERWDEKPPSFLIFFHSLSLINSSTLIL